MSAARTHTAMKIGMNRRFLLTALAGALTAPLGVGAQQTAKLRRIGVLAGIPLSDPLWVGFRDRLRELGYVEGTNIFIKHQMYRIDDHAHMRKSAGDLVALGVDVIVTGGGNLHASGSRDRMTVNPQRRSLLLAALGFALLDGRN